MRYRLFLITLVSLFFLSTPVWSGTYHVDSSGGAANWAACEGADPGGGSRCSVTQAEAGADDDDIVNFYNGTYTDELAPANSGSDATNVVTFQAASGQTAVNWTRSGTSISLNNKDWIVIDGFKFVGGTGHALDLTSGDHNEIKNCTFSMGSSNTTWLIDMELSDYNYLHDNTFNNTLYAAVDEDTEDDFIWLKCADNNRFIDNTFNEGGGHSMIWVGGNFLTSCSSDYNVIRGSIVNITNQWDDNNKEALDIVFGFERSSNNNLIEDSVITLTGTNANGKLYWYQINGSVGNIFRRNIVNGMNGIGTIYLDKTDTTPLSNPEYNMAYNNTFYDVIKSPTSTAFGVFSLDLSEACYNAGKYIRYNQFANNIIHTSIGRAYMSGDIVAGRDNIDSHQMRNNMVYNAHATPIRRLGTNWTVADIQDGNPSMPMSNGDIFSGNLTTEPTFVDAGGGNFTPDDSEAPQVDAGTYLTLANGAGSDSTSLVVDSGGAYFFWDGEGISGETADYICIGGAGPYLISSINKPAHTITLASAQTWANNAEIQLAVSSTACWYDSGIDIGAIEASGGASDTAAPTPDPATFSSNPAADSTTQISMTATTATDETTPISVQFDFDPASDNCGSDTDIGTGGSDRTWTESDYTHSDDGLQINQVYCYNVQYRDAVGTPNVGTASSTVKAYTFAATPTVTLSNATTTTLDITVGVNGNPAANPTTLYACGFLSSSPNDANWNLRYIDAAGDPSVTAVWQSAAAYTALNPIGGSTALQGNTTYGAICKARNGDSIETAWSSTDYEATGPPPIAGTGVVISGGKSSGGKIN